MATENKPIIIDLANSTDAALFNANELLQKEAWDAILDKINASVTDAIEEKGQCCKESNQAIHYTRTHRSLAVFGRRGDGKTTFVINVLEHFRNESKSVYPLDLIDPTLIESREHPLLHIISDIKDRVEDIYKSKPNDSCYQDWQKSLRGLAEGLNALDGIGSEHPNADHWEDPDFIMEMGIKASRGGKRMERQLNQFLADSLHCLGQKMFLVAFDDVDTNFDKGWIILETIRKYLTSPLIQIILCGDLELYLHLIRKNYWAMVHSLTLKEGRKKYTDIVRSLEEQYLLKIVRNQNRITLHPMNALMKNRQILVKTRHGDNQEGVGLEKYLRQKLAQYFHLLPYEYGLYLDLLCHQPTRTVIQVLEAMDVPEGQQESFYETFPQIYLSTIVTLGMKLEDFHSAGGGVTLAALAGYLERHSLWSNPSFQPTRERSDRAILNTLINGIYGNELRKQPALCIAYFVKIGMISRLRDNYKGKNNFLHDVGLTAGTPVLETAQRALGLLKDGQTDVTRFGVVRLYADSLKKDEAIRRIFIIEPTRQDSPPSLSDFIMEIESFPDEFWGIFLNTHRTLKTNITSWHKYIFQTICSFVILQNADTNTFLSFSNILGLTADLITIDNMEAFNRHLLNAATEKPRPWLAADKEDESKQDIENDREIPDDEQVYSIDKKLFDYFQKWKESGSEIIPLHSLQDAFQSALTSFEKLKDLRSKDRTAGWLMHRFCINFLHSILVEEIKQKPGYTTIRQPSTFLDTNFINSLNDSKPPFFVWIWTCPIWGFFLDPTSTAWEKYIEELCKISKEIDKISTDNSKTGKAAHKETSSIETTSEETKTKETCLKEIKKIYEVTYKNKKFPNLFPLLNTLAAHGLTIPPPNGSAKSSKVNPNSPTKDRTKKHISKSKDKGLLTRHKHNAIKAFNKVESIIQLYLAQYTNWDTVINLLIPIIDEYFKESWEDSAYKLKLRKYFKIWAHDHKLPLPEPEPEED